MAMPKEPRAAMIQMMYLVLTAMLALNITKEVLNAFGTINDSIERSNTSITDKNADVYTFLEEGTKDKDRGAKFLPWHQKALELKKETDDILSYLQMWKDSVIAFAGGYEEKDGVRVIKSIDNIDASPTLFIKEKNGDKIKERLEQYKEKMLALVNPDEKDFYAKNFPVNIVDLPKTEENPHGDWTFGTFNNIPVIAAVSMFSKFQNDVKNAESNMLNYFSTKVDAGSWKFDMLEPIAVINQGYALEGQELEATVLLAAYNSTVNPTITSSAGAVNVQNGVGKIKFKASGVGERTVSGNISVSKDGELKTYPYNFKYTVGTAGASLQLDAMNVMYIGVDNPVTISASGYNIQDVKLEVPASEGVTATRGNGGAYTVKVTKPGEFNYTISATRGSAGGKIAGGKIRVKRIPDPKVTLMGKVEGAFPANQIKVQKGLSAKLDDFVFVLPFTVVSFEMYIIPRGADVQQFKNKGAIFEPNVVQALQKVKAGDQVIFSNIKVQCPDNTVRPGNPLTFTII